MPGHDGETHGLSTVMPGQSRSKNGVASLAYVPGIHVLCLTRTNDDSLLLVAITAGSPHRLSLFCTSLLSRVPFGCFVQALVASAQVFLRPSP
jgi:hypothetical protein